MDVQATGSFNYVYDCGSRDTRTCKREITSYVRTLKATSIDILFLSHFDSDHVNGLPDLLDDVRGTKCHTVVLPFVDDVERLASFGRSIIRGKRIGEFFRELTADPVGTIDTLRPRRIILMRATTDGPDGPDIVDPEHRDDDDDPDRPIYAKIKVSGRPGGLASSASVRANVQIADDSEAIQIRSNSRLWLLKPYVRACDQARLSIFEAEIERLLRWPPGSFRPRVKELRTRRQLVSTPATIGALADAYQAAFRDRNLTSMCVFSGPAKTPSGVTERYFDLKRGSYVAKVGWLGTGDISLRTMKNSDEFLEHFSDQRDEVRTFGLPHHGSIRNHSTKVIKALRPSDCVAAAKPPRNWLHPHPTVVADVRSHRSRDHLVNDQPSNAFHEDYLID